MISTKNSVLICSNPKHGREIYESIESSYQRFVAEIHVVNGVPNISWEMSSINKDRLVDFINTAYQIKKKFDKEDDLTFFGIPIKEHESSGNNIYVEHS